MELYGNDDNSRKHQRIHRIKQFTARQIQRKDSISIASNVIHRYLRAV